MHGIDGVKRLSILGDDRGALKRQCVGALSFGFGVTGTRLACSHSPNSHFIPATRILTTDGLIDSDFAEATEPTVGNKGYRRRGAVRKVEAEKTLTQRPRRNEKGRKN